MGTSCGKGQFENEGADGADFYGNPNENVQKNKKSRQVKSEWTWKKKNRHKKNKRNSVTGKDKLHTKVKSIEALTSHHLYENNSTRKRNVNTSDVNICQRAMNEENQSQYSENYEHENFIPTDLSGENYTERIISVISNLQNYEKSDKIITNENVKENAVLENVALTCCNEINEDEPKDKNDKNCDILGHQNDLVEENTTQKLGEEGLATITKTKQKISDNAENLNSKSSYTNANKERNLLDTTMSVSLNSACLSDLEPVNMDSKTDNTLPSFLCSNNEVKNVISQEQTSSADQNLSGDAILHHTQALAAYFKAPSSSPYQENITPPQQIEHKENTQTNDNNHSATSNFYEVEFEEKINSKHFQEIINSPIKEEDFKQLFTSSIKVIDDKETSHTIKQRSNNDFTSENNNTQFENSTPAENFPNKTNCMEEEHAKTFVIPEVIENITEDVVVMREKKSDLQNISSLRSSYLSKLLDELDDTQLTVSQETEKIETEISEHFINVTSTEREEEKIKSEPIENVKKFSRDELNQKIVLEKYETRDFDDNQSIENIDVIKRGDEASKDAKINIQKNHEVNIFAEISQVKTSSSSNRSEGEITDKDNIAKSDEEIKEKNEIEILKIIKPSTEQNLQAEKIVKNETSVEENYEEKYLENELCNAESSISEAEEHILTATSKSNILNDQKNANNLNILNKNIESGSSNINNLTKELKSSHHDYQISYDNGKISPTVNYSFEINTNYASSPVNVEQTNLSESSSDDEDRLQNTEENSECIKQVSNENQHEGQPLIKVSEKTSESSINITININNEVMEHSETLIEEKIVEAAAIDNNPEIKTSSAVKEQQINRNEQSDDSSSDDGEILENIEQNEEFLVQNPSQAENKEECIDKKSTENTIINEGLISNETHKEENICMAGTSAAIIKNENKECALKETEIMKEKTIISSLSNIETNLIKNDEITKTETLSITDKLVCNKKENKNSQRITMNKEKTNNIKTTGAFPCLISTSKQPQNEETNNNTPITLDRKSYAQILGASSTSIQLHSAFISQSIPQANALIFEESKSLKVKEKLIKKELKTETHIANEENEELVAQEAKNKNHIKKEQISKNILIENKVEEIQSIKKNCQESASTSKSKIVKNDDFVTLYHEAESPPDSTCEGVELIQSPRFTKEEKNIENEVAFNHFTEKTEINQSSEGDKIKDNTNPEKNIKTTTLERKSYAEALRASKN